MVTPSASGGNRLPRDAAGHLELTEGTGGIIATNPHVRFVAAVADNVGSSNPIVARVLL
jgi:hypothetical protein